MKSFAKTIRASLLAIGMCLLLGSLSATCLAQTHVFNTASFATGNNPQAVVNADLNGDGLPDLVVANNADGTVSVFLATTSRSFAAAVPYGVGPNPVAVAIADFNNDGKPDLAVVNNNCPTLPCAGAGSISVLLGNGDGTFQTQIPTNVGNGPLGLAAGLFIAGKANVDLAVTNSVDNTVQILIGKGTGAFTTGHTYATGTTPSGVVTADFNADGKLDLVVANTGSSNISYFLGSGNGSFLAPHTFSTGLNPVGVAVADFNNDGIIDVVTANSGAKTVSVLINQGQTGHGFDINTDFGVAGFATQIVATDFNGDGNNDIAVVVPSLNVFSVLLGLGSDVFEPQQNYATGFGPSSLTTTLPTTTLPFPPGQPDFTGDGVPDIAVVNATDNTVEVFPGSCSGAIFAPCGNSTSLAGTFQFPQTTANGVVGNQPSGIATGDFNGDSKIDMAVADRGDGNVLILLGNGNGTFTQGPSYATGTNPAAVVAADFNNDGILDLAVANAVSSTASILLGNGNGTFQPATSFPVGKRPMAIAVGDFNNDHNLDLLIANQNDPSVEILTGNGQGGFTPVKSYFTGTGSTPNQIAVADLNGDGKLDFVVAGGGNNSVVVFLGLGNASFLAGAAYPVGTNPLGVGISDFNGDGIFDLAVANNGSNSVSILLGTGTAGTFGTAVNYPTATTPYLLYAAPGPNGLNDFNSDGKADVVVSAASLTSDRISIMLGNGDGTLQSHVDHLTAFVQKGLGEALAVADFNGDGAPDVVAGDQFANSVTVYLNTPMPGFYPGAPLNFGNVNLGSSSSPQTVTLTNVGGAPLSNVATAASGNYSQTSACPATVAVGADCTTSATFSPTQPGTNSGILTFTDNAPSSPQGLILTGQGNGPSVTLNVTSINFPVTLLGTSSGKQQIMVTNNGNQTLTSISITATAPNFFQTNNCGTSLGVGASCTISVSFHPHNINTLTGTVTITDNAYNSPQSVSLSGTGTEVQLIPTNINFGTLTVGTTSAAQTITLTNVAATNSLMITSVTITGTNSGDFNIASGTTCTNNSTVPAKGSCIINVTFTPQMTGSRTASVSISDNGGGSPQAVALSGTGQ